MLEHCSGTRWKSLRSSEDDWKIQNDKFKISIENFKILLGKRKKKKKREKIKLQHHPFQQYSLS